MKLFGIFLLVCFCKVFIVWGVMIGFICLVYVILRNFLNVMKIVLVFSLLVVLKLYGFLINWLYRLLIESLLVIVWLSNIWLMMVFFWDCNVVMYFVKVCFNLISGFFGWILFVGIWLFLFLKDLKIECWLLLWWSDGVDLCVLGCVLVVVVGVLLFDLFD